MEFFEGDLWGNFERRKWLKLINVRPLQGPEDPAQRR